MQRFGIREYISGTLYMLRVRLCIMLEELIYRLKGAL